MSSKTIEMVAELMALSARTAPKGRGLDSIVIRTVIGKELKELAEEVRRMGMARGLKFLIRDAGNLEQSDACVLIGCVGIDNRIRLRRLRLWNLQGDARCARDFQGQRQAAPRPQLRHQNG